MKRLPRLIAIAAFLAALAFGIVFEAETHVARGWLGGEAFFHGRPTSYWRACIDHWLTQFVEPEDALRCMHLLNGADAVDGVPLTRPARHPFWERMQDLLQSPEAREREWETPHILLGDPDAASVLRELAREERYRQIAESALQER